MAFGTYLKAAFNARPLGMPLPPNWVFLAAVGMVGLLAHPGAWLIGAGLELAYLLALASNRRFQKAVDAQARGFRVDDEATAQRALLTQLEAPAQARQRRLQARCAEITTLPAAGDDLLKEERQRSLDQLLGVHLRLLVAHGALVRVTSSDEDQRTADLERRRTGLLRQREHAAGDLRSALDAQVRVLDQRLAAQREARERQAVVEAELERLTQQVELVREQALLATDAGGVSRTIDAIGEALGTSQRWLEERPELLGGVAPLPVPAPRAGTSSRSATPESL